MRDRLAASPGCDIETPSLSSSARLSVGGPWAITIGTCQRPAAHSDRGLRNALHEMELLLGTGARVWRDTARRLFGVAAGSQATAAQAASMPARVAVGRCVGVRCDITADAVAERRSPR